MKDLNACLYIFAFFVISIIWFYIGVDYGKKNSLSEFQRNPPYVILGFEETKGVYNRLRVDTFGQAICSSIRGKETP